MSNFESSARRALAARSPHRVWLGLRRCVEAYTRLSGQTFSQVLTDLGGLVKPPDNAEPTLANLHAAVSVLSGKRATLLLERNRLITERRHARHSGTPCPAGVADALRTFERTHQQANRLIPGVGVWGWGRLRKHGLGPPIAVAEVSGMQGLSLSGTPPLRLTLDLRGWPTPLPAIAERLTRVSCFEIPVIHFVLLIDEDDAESWGRSIENAAMRAELAALRDLPLLGPSVWLVHSGSAPHCEALRQSLEAQRWRLARLPSATF